MSAKLHTGSRVPWLRMGNMCHPICATQLAPFSSLPNFSLASLSLISSGVGFLTTCELSSDLLVDEAVLNRLAECSLHFALGSPLARSSLLAPRSSLLGRLAVWKIRRLARDGNVAGIYRSFRHELNSSPNL